jgi:hypothetical protein
VEEWDAGQETIRDLTNISKQLLSVLLYKGDLCGTRKCKSTEEGGRTVIECEASVMQRSRTRELGTLALMSSSQRAPAFEQLCEYAQYHPRPPCRAAILFIRRKVPPRKLCVESNESFCTQRFVSIYARNS